MDIQKYHKGEMYWYVNDDEKKESYLKDGINQDFLSTRPVLIVSNYVDVYASTVMVIPTSTSAHRFGIDIEMIGSNGESESTKLLPYRIRTVPIKYLKDYIGQANSEIIRQVDDALSYHLGINTSNAPKYVTAEKEKHVELKLRNNCKKYIVNASGTNKNVIDKPNEQKQKKKKSHKIVYKLEHFLDDNNKNNIISGIYEKYNHPSIITDQMVIECTNVTQNMANKFIKQFTLLSDKFYCIANSSSNIAKKYNITRYSAEQMKELSYAYFKLQQLIFNRYILKDINSKLTFAKDDIKFIFLLSEIAENIMSKNKILAYKSRFINDLNINSLIEWE